MNEEQAHNIFAQLVKGLHHMHSVGLVHRDLKLLNIFVNDSSDMPGVVIGDLGLCVLL